MSVSPKSNLERLSDWRQRHPDALAQLAEIFRKARGIPPDPQSKIALTLVAQDVEQVLGVVFQVTQREEDGT